MATATLSESISSVVRQDEVYSLEEFQRRTKLKRWAYRTALRNGLRVIRTGGRVFVRGSDWFDYLANVTPDGER